MASNENSIVEVIVGGVKMRYPSCYVLVTDMDESANSEALNGVGVGSGGAAPVAAGNGMLKTENSKFGLVGFGGCLCNVVS